MSEFIFEIFFVVMLSLITLGFFLIGEFMLGLMLLFYVTIRSVVKFFYMEGL